ncbi:MAG: ASCH domain-containing protein [Bacilli bacterium]|nr:ASCH domain-containing protein [Bacilli bacterium]
MKAITVKQPWATLIAEGLKEYEFRTWKTKYRGEILIHAGKSIDKKAMKKFEYLNLEYPTGCIIAKGNITDCVEVDNNFRKKLLEKDKIIYSGVIKCKEWKGYGFKIENIRKISSIPIKGRLSLWDYQEDYLV